MDIPGPTTVGTISAKLGLAPKVLQNLSGSAELFFNWFLLYETFRRTFLQNPKGSAEFWGGGGAQKCLLRTGFITMPSPPAPASHLNVSPCLLRPCPSLSSPSALEIDYIYIYAGEALGCPHFGLQRVNGLAPLKVNRLSTFLGAIFAL